MKRFFFKFFLFLYVLSWVVTICPQLVRAQAVLAILATGPSLSVGADATSVALPPPDDVGSLYTQMGQLREELERYRKGGDEKQLGYDGGFYIASRDEKFRFNVNGRFQGRYSFNLAEGVQNGHTVLLRRAFLIFSGSAFTPKAVFTIQTNLNVSPFLDAYDFGYDFRDAIKAHVILDSMPFEMENIDSSGEIMFLSGSLPGIRYDFPINGVIIAGEYHWLSYLAGVFNSLGDLGAFRVNVNNELAYLLRLDFNVLSTVTDGQSDIDDTEKPALKFGLAGVFGHYETDTQARVIAGTGDVRFKYKGLSVNLAGTYRQTDPDQFTRAQTDLGFAAYAGYFIIPRHFEIAARVSALIDDVNNVGNNIGMGGDLDTHLDGVLVGGDVGEDSDNEWEYALGINYYFKGFPVKIQAQYSLMLDGVAGPDDLVNHIGMAQVQLGF